MGRRSSQKSDQVSLTFKIVRKVAMSGFCQFLCGTKRLVDLAGVGWRQSWSFHLFRLSLPIGTLRRVSFFGLVA